MFHVYLARCSDNSLYTGYTSDLKQREATHNSGRGASYTRSRLPIEFVYFETFKTRSEAMKREHEIKRWKRERKEDLVKKG